MNKNTVFDELNEELPRIAKLLNTIIDELAIIDYIHHPSKYMSGLQRDQLIASYGLTATLPLIQQWRFQGTSIPGYGLFIYKNKISGIDYAIYNMRGNRWDDEPYLICNKKDLFELTRSAQELNKRETENHQAPILEEGILDDVLNATLGFLYNANEIEKFGVKIKQGIILDGPPGNGKTMLCRYIQKLCTQRGIQWGVITSSDINEAHQEGSLFELFSKYTVSFFDDIDVAYMNRNKGRADLACNLLSAMDGIHQKSHLVRIFTTNEKIDDLDTAFTRPGRIDKCITINKPTDNLRRQLVETWPEEIKQNIDIDHLIEKSKNYSFAELEAVRTFLVTNKVSGGGWDLQKALAYHREQKEEKVTSVVGFSKN